MLNSKKKKKIDIAIWPLAIGLILCDRRGDTEGRVRSGGKMADSPDSWSGEAKGRCPNFLILPTNPF